MNRTHAPRPRRSLKGARHWLACLLMATGVLTTEAALASEPAPHKSTARHEIMFMEGMIPHHLAAARMASQCLERATHSELLEICRTIASPQKKEAGQMQSWLKDWYNEGDTPELFEHTEIDIRHMASLSGEAFEKAFMKRMIPHHMIAIQEAAECQVRAFHVPLLNMCHDIVKAQADEIHAMRDWLCKWYGICGLELRRAAMTEEPGQSAGHGTGFAQRLQQLREHMGR